MLIYRFVKTSHKCVCGYTRNVFIRLREHTRFEPPHHSSLASLSDLVHRENFVICKPEVIKEHHMPARTAAASRAAAAAAFPATAYGMHFVCSNTAQRPPQRWRVRASWPCFRNTYRYVLELSLTRSSSSFMPMHARNTSVGNLFCVFRVEL